ncbi:unnamed protein product [Victoria cruziana]
MDRELEQLRLLGFFGIYKKAFKIIDLHRRLFGLISLTLVLPLSVIFLANYEISDAISTKIYQTEVTPNRSTLDKLSWERAQFWLFRVSYLIIAIMAVLPKGLLHWLFYTTGLTLGRSWGMGSCLSSSSVG